MDRDRDDLALLCLLTAGVALVALGAGLIFLPAAPLVAGALVIAGVLLYLRGASAAGEDE
jgi:hypothetical protein